MGRDYLDFPRLYSEIDPRDVVFRANFADKERQEKPPFMSQDCPMITKHLEIWDRLFTGEITEEAALEEITLLMEEYYGFKYPLYRGFNH